MYQLIMLITVSIFVPQVVFARTSSADLNFEKSKKLCESGDGKSCFFVGTMYMRPINGFPKQSHSQAEFFLSKGCDLKEKDACINLINLCRFAECKSKIKRAMQTAWGACDFVNLASSNECEGVRKMALGGSRSLDSFLYEACSYQLGDACFVLGSAYLEGKKVKKDVEYSKKLFESSCGANYALGCRILGVMISKTSPEKSAMFLQKGCLLKDTVSCKHLETLQNKRAISSEYVL